MKMEPRTRLLYHFCRLQLPGLVLAQGKFQDHLQRCFGIFRAKRSRAGASSDFPAYLANLYAVDWYLCCACLENQAKAWDILFAARASRTDCLLVDALRARAVRLFPRDLERQEEAVTDFWGYLIAGERAGVSILARYDGQRPLVPWLIRVFQNKHISELRANKGMQALPDDNLDEHDLPFTTEDNGRWHDEFRAAAREWLGELKDNDLLLLGLRGRCRMKQRDVAHLLGVHEGNISRQTTKLRDTGLEFIGQRLRELGWTGDDLSDFVLKEMDSLLLDEPRLGLDHLAGLLAQRGRKLPHSIVS
jgi:RNA polymerase sigma factor (sigma-70 family)